MRRRWSGKTGSSTEQAVLVPLRCFSPAEKLGSALVAIDFITSKERPGLPFTAGMSDPAGSPGVIHLIERAIARAREHVDGGCAIIS